MAPARVLLRRAVPAIVLTLLLTGLAAPAGAAHEEGHAHNPTLRHQRAYFRCLGGVKVQNLPAALGQIPAWTTLPPGSPSGQGAGCAFYDNLLNNLQGHHPFNAVWQGIFSGNLDSLTVHLHRVLPTDFGTPSGKLTVTVIVDGEKRADHIVYLEHFPTVGSTATNAEFTLRGLGYLIEDGNGTKLRTIRLMIASWDATQSVWGFGSSDMPAGITFNPTAPAAKVIDALPPEGAGQGDRSVNGS